MELKDFGNEMRRLRNEKNMTIRQLEEASKVSNSYISQIEKGEKLPSPEILRKLAPHLGVTHSELMFKAGHIGIDEVNTNYAAAVQAQSVFDFFKILKEKYNVQDDLPEHLKAGLAEIISEHKITGITEANFLPSLEKVRDGIIDRLKNGDPLEAYLADHHDLFRIQYQFAKKYFEESKDKTSPIAQNIKYFISLLIGDRERDFLGSIEQVLSERIGELIEKYNISLTRKITVSDENGVRQDIPEQYSDMILEIDNPQFQWEVLQELQNIAHEFHIKWNSAYEVGARQPRPKKLEDIIQRERITYNGHLLEEEDRQRVLEMLKLLFPNHR
ncbi:helix-turn-helix domain-containing protein [Paenibacillus sp. USDA918EY]|uniref:helix-turn-helix domain-containing protein n=1 Tax=Paenibacillus sp. USDA918EY TaxID=2689575 RepID=UPI00135AAEF2|nr:helix-turn-helix transcriptional regulator [Paenibacillus sp. USDA918EY]